MDRKKKERKVIKRLLKRLRCHRELAPSLHMNVGEYLDIEKQLVARIDRLENRIDADLLP